jgi:AraC-like DNA-binding protein
MALTAHFLASGPFWRVDDIICTAGPQDRPFAEQHHGACIAAVLEGTFQYRSVRGAAVLAPGAVLLGNDGDGFECGHQHGTGDRCLSFHVTPEFLEAVAPATPGVRQAAFAVPALPPLPRLIAILAAAEVARDEGDAAALEEQVLTLAATVLAALAGTEGAWREPSRRDEKRITDALRRIEAAAQEPLSLAELAASAAMSPYHFLRVFRQVAGVTPHQFILQTRLRRAAARLRRSTDSILAIALDTGFNDLSSFNRRFRLVIGLSPGAYRARLRIIRG